MTCAKLAEMPAEVSLVAFPDGSFSGTAYIKRGRRRNGEVDGLGDEAYWSLSDEERKALNLGRSNRQAARDMRWKIRRNDLRRLLTFTNGASGGGWSSLAQAVRHVLDWYLHHGGRELLGETAFVCVPERGKRGLRIHVHAAIRAGYRLDYSAIRRSWSVYLTAQGFVSTAKSGEHRFHAGDEEGRGKVGFASARTCADYMAKYLVKGFETEARLAYEKRFRSDGCLRPEPRRWSGFALGGVPGLLRGEFGSDRVECVWFDALDEKYGGWWVEVAPPGRTEAA